MISYLILCRRVPVIDPLAGDCLGGDGGAAHAQAVPVKPIQVVGLKRGTLAPALGLAAVHHLHQLQRPLGNRAVSLAAVVITRACICEHGVWGVVQGRGERR